MSSRLSLRRLSATNRLLRIVWRTVWLILFRPSPRILHGWRRLLLRLFGAKLGKHTYVYPSVQIWAPWNLVMGDHSCLSHFVDCYCVDKIVLDHKATVSQYTHLCTASHDYNKIDMPLITAPILIRSHAWITSNVFIGPGVTVNEGAVVAACSTVTRDVPAWTVVAGSPAIPIGNRDSTQFVAATQNGSL